MASRKASHLTARLVSPSAAKELLQGIKGHVVSFPYEFLYMEYLGPGLGVKEGWVPMKTFT